MPRFPPMNPIVFELRRPVTVVVAAVALVAGVALSTFRMNVDIIPAVNLPVVYLVLSTATKPDGQIKDQALNRVRPMFAAIAGVSAPPPFGGSKRTFVVRL